MNPVFADVSADALQAATDAIAAHNVGVAIVAGVVIVVPLVLKAFKVPVPFLDPVLEMVLKAAALVFKGKKVVLPEPAPEEVAKQPGIAEVVPIKKDGA
jgi:hypothetical protein